MKNKQTKKLTAFSLIEISIVVLIVGILIAGITQSSRLISLAKVNTAKSLTQGSPAASINDLSLWIETSAKESFQSEDIEDGDLVTQWNDLNPQSSTRANLVTSGGSPVYKSNIINGLPAVCFNDTNLCGTSTGTSNSLSTTNFPSIVNGEATVLAVVRAPSTLAAQTIFSNGTSSPNIRFGTTASTWTYFDSAASYTASSTMSAGGNYIVSLVYHSNSTSTGANSNTGIAFFQDGAAAGVSSTTSTPGTGTELFIGQNGSSASYFTGFVGELIIYDRALKTEERQSVESYLSKKWGIKVAVAAY